MATSSPTASPAPAPRRPVRGRRPSAPFVIGAITGSIAAAAVLPSALALYGDSARSERALASRHAAGAASVAVALAAGDAEAELPSDLTGLLDVAGVYVYRPDGTVRVAEGPTPDPQLPSLVCTDQRRVVLEGTDGVRWVAACVRNPAATAIVTVVLGDVPILRIGVLVASIASLVGLLTGVTVLNMLGPLSRISAALQRVSAGERGVRVARSGLPELDELVYRLNAAAEAVEDREDGISARIQVVQEMARMVAHEVRNPLQSLEILTSLVASEDDAEEREQLASSIHGEIRSLERVVTRLLKKGAGESLSLVRGRHSVGELVEQLVKLRGPGAQARGIRLEVGPLDPGHAFVDQALVVRSIENLVKNAIEAVEPGRGVVRVSVVQADGEVVVHVDDNGKGIDPRVRDHLFEPNVTNKKGGSGLGLALVRGVIEAHGGYIEHAPSPLGGARFLAHLPIEEVPGADEAP